MRFKGFNTKRVVGLNLNEQPLRLAKEQLAFRNDLMHRPPGKAQEQDLLTRKQRLDSALCFQQRNGRLARTRSTRHENMA